MANIKVMHKAAVISTDLSVKDIRKLEAVAPDALTIKDGEGNVIFSIATSDHACISKYGIVFAGDSKISTLIDAPRVNKDLIEEAFGGILLQLSRVEEQANDALAEFNENVEDLIEFVDEDEEDVE